MKNLTSTLAVAALLLLLLVAGTAGLVDLVAAASGVALGAGFLLKDKLLRQTHALPNGAATTNGGGIDLELSTLSEFIAETEAVVTAPVLTTGELGDTQTITYSLYHDTAVGFGSETLLATLGVQTGAGGAGAAAAEYRSKLPSNVKRYLRLKTVKTGASNASTKSGTLELAF